MEKEGLDKRQEAIVPIAAFTAGGDLKKLGGALEAGLDAGLAVGEIKEILVQLYAYAGFPRSLNAINTFIDVLDAREKRGVKDEPGREPAPLPAGKSSLELGTEIQTALIGAPAAGRYIAFAPAIDRFLKGHLFGDIFGRDNLDHRSREIATIAALANIEGVEPQLASHFRVGLNVGLTEGQLKDLVAVLETGVGHRQAVRAGEVLGTVLGEKKAAPPASGAGEADPQAIRITRSGGQTTTKGPEDYFTGSVRVAMLVSPAAPARTSVGRVTFEPGARTAWHTHPFGQTLIVTEGQGRIRRWGGPVEEIRPGDVVSIPPGTKHWHGASTDVAMTHLAIQEQLDGKSADWMEMVED